LALKLRATGLTTERVVLVFATAAAALSAGAYLLTLTPFLISLVVVSGILLVGLFVMIKLHDVVVH
jgi:fatty acid desaturase